FPVEAGGAGSARHRRRAGAALGRARRRGRPARRSGAGVGIRLAGWNMDEIDRLLLDILQQDATLSIAQMAERVGLSATPCWKRIQKLEARGVITRRVA